MRKNLLTLFAALICCFAFPTLGKAETTITWNASVLAGCNIRYNDYPNSFSNGGITVTINHDGRTDHDEYDGYISFGSGLNPNDPEDASHAGEMYTFSCATANITRIEISCEETQEAEFIVADGWTISSPGLIWSGTPASSVNFGMFVTRVTQIVFTLGEESSGGEESDSGMLSGVFSISDSRTVHFSRGNLQYKGSDQSWRFAEHQYDVIGDNTGNTTNRYEREMQSDWIDLFGWGTGDEPWKSSGNVDYYNSYTEWGSQFDTESGWRTLTYEEWNYLLFERYDFEHPGVSFAKGSVNGVNGLIILPNDWSTSNYELSNTGYTEANFSENDISLSDWTTHLEANGAVFLPSAGLRNDNEVFSATENGHYWTASNITSEEAYSLSFDDGNMAVDYEMQHLYYGYAVRLVSAGPALPAASITTDPAAINGLVFNGSWQTLITAGTTDDGEMQYSMDNIDWSSSLPSRRNAGVYTIYYKVVGDAEHSDYIPENNSISVTISPKTNYAEEDANIETCLAALTDPTNLTINRTVYKDGYYNTICLPVDMSAAEISASDLAGCELFAFDDASVSGNVLSLYISPADAIVAGVPYLIKWPNTSADAQDITLSFSDITIGATAGASVGDGSVQFVGTIGRTELPVDEDYLFVGANNTLHWSNNDGTIMKAFRAYFIVGSDPVISPRQTPARLVVRPKAPTDLESIENSEFSIQKVLRNGQLIIIRGDKEYDAQGQKLK